MTRPAKCGGCRTMLPTSFWRWSRLLTFRPFWRGFRSATLLLLPDRRPQTSLLRPSAAPSRLWVAELPSMSAAAPSPSGGCPPPPGPTPFRSTRKPVPTRCCSMSGRLWKDGRSALRPERMCRISFPSFKRQRSSCAPPAMFTSGPTAILLPTSSLKTSAGALPS